MKEQALKILPRFLNISKCRVDTGGAMHLKAATENSIVHPHQDSPIIDERNDYVIQTWVPLSNVDDRNGCMYILPGSHLWGNFQRSLNVPWPFVSCTGTLWKYMIPVPMKLGDVLCFDPAVIHGSKPNQSIEERYAITLLGVPKNLVPINYYRDKSTPHNKVERYQVDQQFWMKGTFLNRPGPGEAVLELEDWVFNRKLWGCEVKYFLDGTNHYLKTTGSPSS
jgi:ectoine hydroxylase-related dioxygenase (phytanoyl-CoA dioxygenase family)